MTGYVKLFGSILGSTIWRENPATKVIWITLLALVNRDGIAESSVPGLANYAGVSIAETETALQKFQSPDPYSRTSEHEGRRIEPIDGGWRILNHDKYRWKMSKEDIRERDRIRKQRQREREKCPIESGTKRDTSEMSAKSNKSRKQKAESTPSKVNPSAHSMNERGGDDSDVSMGDTPKSKRAASRTLFVENLYSRYPRKIAKAAAFKAIEKAIVAVARRDHEGDEKEATDWLGSRIDLYAKSAQGQQPDKSKIPYPATWFNAGRYDDDESEWGFVVGGTKGNGARVSETDQDSGFTEVLSRPDPDWVEAGTR